MKEERNFTVTRDPVTYFLIKIQIRDAHSAQAHNTHRQHTHRNQKPVEATSCVSDGDDENEQWDITNVELNKTTKCREPLVWSKSFSFRCALHASGASTSTRIEQCLNVRARMRFVIWAAR